MAKSIVSSRRLLCGLTEAQYDKVLNDLTLPNPQYESALKYSGYSQVSLPKFLYFYKENEQGILVPRGYDPNFPNMEELDERADHFVNFPRFLLKLRNTQQKAVEAFLYSGEQDGFIVIPTGAGKSIVGAKLAAMLGQSTLIIVQKDDLISGWRKDIMLTFGLKPCQIGLVKAKKFRIGKQFTLTTIQTLCKLEEEKVEELRSCIGTIIQDEGHRAGANSYKVIDTFPARHRIGLTATYMRNDVLISVLHFYFGKVVFQADEADGIIEAKNVIIHPRTLNNIRFYCPDIYVNQYNRPIEYINVDGKSYKISTLDQDDLNYFISKGLLRRKSLDYSKVKAFLRSSVPYNDEIIKDIMREYAFKKSCVVFCAEKEHLYTLKRMLLEQGIAEDKIQLYCGDATESKESMKSAAESKRVLITLATLAIATEGTNVKAWESLFLAMSIGNEKDLIQVIGRGRRNCSGKTLVNVFDYRTPNVKGVGRHSLLRDSIYDKYGFTIENPNLKTLGKAHVGWM